MLRSEVVTKLWKTALVERGLFNEAALKIGQRRRWTAGERGQIQSAHHLFDPSHEFQLQVRDLDECGEVLGFDPTIEARVEAEVKRRLVRIALAEKLRSLRSA